VVEPYLYFRTLALPHPVRCFPIEVSSPLLRRLERASPASGRETWQRAIETSAEAAAARSPDGKRFIKIENNQAQLWDAETGRLLATLTSPEPLTAARFSPDGRRLTTEVLGGGRQVWDLATGQLIERSPK
jgi:WD40 repeat protein